MKAGDTFLIPLPGTSLDSHLWIVLSDPEQDPRRILIVNLTTVRDGSDPACVLHVGDHHFVRHDTCVSYAGAKVVSGADIERLFQAKALSHNVAVSPEVLERIRRGAGDSTRMRMEHADILVDQGLLDC